MKKNLLQGLTVFNTIALLGLIAYQFLIGSERIVYVDSNKLINGYSGMLDARKSYQEKAAVWKANIDTLTNEVKQQIMTYEKESGKMTQKERQLSQELIRTKQEQLAQYQQAMNAKAREEDQKMTGEVLTQINAYIKKYGEANRYRIIVAATEYGNLAYADEELDITEEVLEGLNNEYEGK